jgi:hypothetical protein
MVGERDLPSFDTGREFLSKGGEEVDPFEMGTGSSGI